MRLSRPQCELALDLGRRDSGKAERPAMAGEWAAPRFRAEADVGGGAYPTERYAEVFDLETRTSGRCEIDVAPLRFTFSSSSQK